MRFRNNAQIAALALIIILGLPAAAFCQRFSDTFLLEYTYSSPSEGDFEDEIEIHEGKAGFLIPFSTSTDGGIGFATGAYFQADVWSPDNEDLDDVDLYKGKIPIFIDFKFTDDLSTIFNVTPGIHSDFEEVDEDDFRVDGWIQFNYALNKNLQISLGAAIGEEFGEAQAFPIGGVRWQATDNLLLDLMIPYPRAQLAFSDNFHLFLFGEPSGGEWNVGDSEETQVDIQQKGFRAGAGLEFGLTEKGWIYMAAGVEGGRELQIAVNDDEVFDDEVDLDDQAFFRVGFKVTR